VSVAPAEVPQKQRRQERCCNDQERGGKAETVRPNPSNEQRTKAHDQARDA
jgi:hypothetical protein